MGKFEVKIRKERKRERERQREREERESGREIKRLNKCRWKNPVLMLSSIF